IAAIRSALNSCGKVILKDHLEGCVVEAVKEGDDTVIEKLNEAIDKYIR
ncbi:metal-sensing transcriptional repressor, partial [Bacillus sp. NTK034]|nr:metal-sensing transcriptional repressor [Bacillus sp. NTK034]